MTILDKYLNKELALIEMVKKEDDKLQSISMMKIPTDIPFELGVSEVSNRNIASEQPHHLINIESSIYKAIATVKRQVSKEIKVPPLVLSQLARGGKTTFLQLLFDQLKKDFNPISITFNNGFKRKDDESQLEALLRLVASQLLSKETLSEYYDNKLICDKKILMKYIEETSNGKPVVLLIDELNTLAFPFEDEVAEFLKTEFLDKPNRYLVYTTHVPLDIEKNVLGGSNKNSNRGFEVVEAVTCFDLNELRKMDDCEYLTKLEMYLYGGIPSLIYSAKTDSYTPYRRFSDYIEMHNITITKEMIGCFIDEVLNGGNIHNVIDRVFDRFASLNQIKGKLVLRWPLCYIACVIEYLND